MVTFFLPFWQKTSLRGCLTDKHDGSLEAGKLSFSGRAQDLVRSSQLGVDLQADVVQNLEVKGGKSKAKSHKKQQRENGQTQHIFKVRARIWVLFLILLRRGKRFNAIIIFVRQYFLEIAVCMYRGRPSWNCSWKGAIQLGQGEGPIGLVGPIFQPLDHTYALMCAF